MIVHFYCFCLRVSMLFISNKNAIESEMIGGVFRNKLFVRSFASICNSSMVVPMLDLPKVMGEYKSPIQDFIDFAMKIYQFV